MKNSLLHTYFSKRDDCDIMCYILLHLLHILSGGDFYMKLKGIAFYTICATLLISFVFLIITSFYRLSLYTAVENLTYDYKSDYIIIDSGHGGEDGGAVSDDGILEKDINLEISRKLSDTMKILGFDVKETRKEDTSLDTEGSTIRERKVSDMKKRLAIFNGNSNNVVISIHQNKFTESKYSGTQLFYSPNTPDSALLAESIKNSVVDNLQPENTRECKKADNNIYLLKNATVPAVIVECGFISNHSELKNLINQNYQKEMSYSIAIGYINYKNTKN